MGFTALLIGLATVVSVLLAVVIVFIMVTVFRSDSERPTNEAGVSRGLDAASCPCSPECVEGVFSEHRAEGVPRM